MIGVNVVFMGNFLYPHGMAGTKRVQHFIDGVLREPGNSAAVLLLRQSHPGRDVRQLRGEHKGVVYETIGDDLGGTVTPGALWRYLLRGMGFLRRHRRPGGRNVLFVYGGPSIENLPFIAAARTLGYRVIVDIVEDLYLVRSDAPVLSRMKAGSTRWSTEHIGWFAGGVVVISSYLQRKLEALTGGRCPVRLIPVSVELDRLRPRGAGFHRPLRLLYAGSFGEKDGVENLIAAFERVAQVRPGIELVMTGRGDPTRMAALEQRLATSPARERIRYLGFLTDEEYFEALAECDIPCVVRVRSDFAERGFPFKLGEYLATGRPVIAARTGDVGHYLTDRVHAMLVEPGVVEDIVKALEYLLEDEGRALAIGRAGREVAERHFSARSSGRLLLDLLVTETD